ncbi:FG-GAP-like repeat-containing protein [Parasphingorhabdus sp. DH2-15]|uniref:FG-GAP-like repeat-containing protein n=1 Tax=Parasphingorhabdus sp. DH2-15 TaxID=3444112 RepID=UPI003F686EDD
MSNPLTRKTGLDTRLLISAVALIALALFFWTQSRYPALNEKALMGGDTPLSGLSFDIIFDIFPNSPLWWEFVANIANWIFTNLKGMTFGVLFGAAMLTLLSVIKKKSFENGFANAALGAVIGAPLGVCVNCAAPIALGLHMGRMRLETTLSALIASPTLNVIVVTMSFSLLPFHVAGTKLLLSLIMVLLVIPLLCKFWLKEETAASANNMSALSKVSEPKGLTGWIAKALAPQEYEQHDGNFFGAVTWYLRVFGRNLFYIAIITVPMMFVAAMLGAIVATWFDTSALKYLLPTIGPVKIIIAMIALAAVATFAPAPIALDIILTAILLGIGLNTSYATVILISLGTFSIYAFIILWRSISLKTALSIWVLTMGMAVTGGVIAKMTQKYEQAYYKDRAENHLINANMVEMPKIAALPSAPDFGQLSDKIAAQSYGSKSLAADIAGDKGSNITLTQAAKVGADNSLIKADPSAVFTRISGQKIGLEELGMLHPHMQFGASMMNGGLASGDVHGDGWVDIVTRRPTGATGLSLYTNIGGRFQRQDMPLGPIMQSRVLVPALVDLDNDQQLDLVASTIGDGIYIFYNQGGYFDEENSTHIEAHKFDLATSLAFADMDSNGFLDIILGRWADGAGTEGWGSLTSKMATNQILWNNGDRALEKRDIIGSAGQTLTLLVSDFNDDGRADLLKGDDVAGTDQILFFESDRKIATITADSQPFDYFMRTSMSYDVGDWNNDLRRDYYGGQIANGRQTDREATRGDGRILEICQQFAQDNGWDVQRTRTCAIEQKSIDLIRASKSSAGLASCSAAQFEQHTTICFALEYHKQLLKAVKKRKTPTAEKAKQQCERHLAVTPEMLYFCDAYATETFPRLNHQELKKEHKPSLSSKNILMTGTATGGFSDVAGETGVSTPGWSWNSRFTDLDQDGWQDLLVMTGIWLASSQSTTNVFYRNNKDGFTDRTGDFGFTDLVPSYSHVSFDYDRDGDIDVIRDATASRMIVHRNDRPAGKALWVYLRDMKGNSMAVGATVTICMNGVTSLQPGKCQMRDIKASGGFQSFDPIAAHFGLGQKTVSFIHVRWPDGEISKITPQDALDSGEITIARQ